MIKSVTITETASEAEYLLDLPNEVLITIFEYLLPSDRRVASQCCKRLLKIWLRDKFFEDRVLYFSECILDPELEPCSIILKSQRSYKHLTLYNVTFHDGLDKLWTVLGKNVTTIELSCWFVWPDKTFWEMFPKLEVLRLQGSSEQENYNFEFLPLSLQKMSIIMMNMGVVLKALHENYLKFRTNAINFESDQSMEFKDIHFIQKHQQNIQKLVIWIDGTMKSDFLKLHLQHVKHLDINLPDDINYYRTALSNLEEQFPELEYLKLTVFTVLPYKNWRYLKSLSVSRLPQEELLRLKTFENLEELNLKTTDCSKECFFVHEPYLNKSLKKLVVRSTDERIGCLTCFKAMTETFPKLESFESDLMITNAHLKLLAENSPKLNYLVIKRCQPGERLSFENLPKLSLLHLYWYSWNEEPDFDTWPLMPHLRELTIKVKHLNNSSVKMFEKVPALEDLFLYCYSVDDDVQKLILALLKPFKRLKRLLLSCEANIYCSNETLSGIANNCQYLQIISLEGNCGIDACFEDYAKKIFKEHSSIRQINIKDKIFQFKDFQKISEKTD